MQSLIVKNDDVPLDQVRLIMSEHFGLSGTLKTLASEKDQLFHVETQRGEVLLKVANQAETPEASALQVNVLLHIAERAPTLPVQRVVPTLDGQSFLRVRFPETAIERNVRVVSYLPGLMLKHARRGVAQATALGEVWAELGLALRNFADPAARHQTPWDLQSLGERAGWIDDVEDDERRRLLRAGYERFESSVAPHLSNLRTQAIHNDFSGDNVLVQADEPDIPTGILDFGDLVHSQLVNDVAVCTVEFIAAHDPDLAVARAFVAGYASVVPLDDRETAVLPDLVIARMVLRMTIAEWRAKRFPDNASYLLRNMPTVRDSLTRVLAMDRNRLGDIFAQGATGQQPA